MKYQLRRDSAMYRLWDALPLGQWVTAQELRRLTVMRDGTRHSALSALIARNLVQRRQSRSHLTAYDYLKLPEDAAVVTPDGPPDGATSPVGGPDRAPVDAGGVEPFWTPKDAPPISGGADEPPSAPLTPAPHGTARSYMAGCRCVECTRAYETTRKALGL